ncbi:MAG: hypothetical protein H0V07_02765 [Propionibacteriales bacterium]|nr:hypothetical protein [Propionibacteriales bacterium]
MTTAPETETEIAPETAPETEAPEGPGREAAKYRRQLRDAEASLASLSTRVETMQRREVERLAASELETPADLWLADTSLPDLLDDDGEIDEAKVTQAIEFVLADRPGWKRTTPPSFDGGARTSVPRGISMQELLQGRRRP